jgi:hypothetical protein
VPHTGRVMAGGRQAGLFGSVPISRTEGHNMTPVIESAEWLNARQASQQAGCSPTALQRAALLGQVRCKIELGVPPRYHRDDVMRIAQTRPDTVGRRQ